MGERHEWARRNQGWALTRDIEEQARKFDWDGDWPEVDTDGYLTGECVEPTPDGAWTVVDVIQPNDAPPYVQEGSGASMAVVCTADLQARQAIETAAPSPGGVLDGVMIEQGDQNDWTVRIYLRSHDSAKLVAFLERLKAGGLRDDTDNNSRAIGGGDNQRPRAGGGMFGANQPIRRAGGELHCLEAQPARLRADRR